MSRQQPLEAMERQIATVGVAENIELALREPEDVVELDHHKAARRER